MSKAAPVHYAVQLIIACVLLVAGCGQEAGERAKPRATSERAADDIALNNRGVALMGRFEYAAAREVFAELVRRRPEWPAVKLNLAIATLNRQETGDEEAATALVDEVLAAEPRNLRAHYLAGLLALYAGRSEPALEHLLRVAKRDPGDAYAAYFTAQSLMQAERVAEALPWYERAIERDPYLRSAYYGSATALRRLDRADEARVRLEEYQRFADNPRARLAEFKYTRMGPKAEAQPASDPDAPPPAQPEGPLFDAPVRVAGDLPSGSGAALTTADIDGDGRQDIFLTHARADQPNIVLLGRENGDFAPRRKHPLTHPANVAAALWGDIDNDGLVDVYLCRRGANQLWRQHAPGDWRDVSDASGTANKGACAAGALFDADHDGDLDIFVVNENGADELYNNDLDGGFRPLATTQGLADATGGAGIVVADLDRDRDVDIVVLREQPPHDVWLNDRLWRYRPAKQLEAFRAEPAIAATAGDVDADGAAEIYTVDTAGTIRRWRVENGEWSPQVLREGTGEDAPHEDAELGLFDFDGDGVLELLVAGRGGFAVYEVDGRSARPTFTERGEYAAFLPVLTDPRRGSSLAGLGLGEGRAQLELWQPGSGRYPFVALRLTGREERGESMRSNASGIGAAVALRVGSRWTLANTFEPYSAPGQSLQPLSIGLGGAPRADYVAIDWSDGVFQTELGLEPGAVTRITETQRQLASCPVLFAWDGREYAFVSDLLGVGGLGFLVAPQGGAAGGPIYAPPRPWEFFRLPEGAVRSRDGRYVFKLTEPMEEVAYFDAFRLHVYDLPPGWSMVLDERFGAGAPQPTGQPLFFRRAVSPTRAINDRGDDVTATLLERDLAAAPVGPHDQRFIGRLAAPHVLTLEFDTVLDQASPVLVADGWIEYPYSQTIFAAWQAEASFAAPTLEARGRDGLWRVVYDQFGYPAGMPREMALPLDGLPAGTTALRLSTTQEVYWDRIRVAFAEPPPEIQRRIALPELAVLRQPGFAHRSTGPQRVPHYEYAERTTFWDAKYPTGLYTRFGDVLPLVAALDDAFVVMGPGEETHFEFDAGSAPPAGWRRALVLEARGFAKDMDLYTQHGDTVGPLPVSAGADPGRLERREVLHDRYNVRFQAGR
ncbi:hypothetical protein BH24PSE2_BH24PSE2_02610 [soil metagenome]